MLTSKQHAEPVQAALSAGSGTFSKSGVTERTSASLADAGASVKKSFVGIARPIRMAIVAAALREAGISSPAILPTSVTRR